MTETFRNLTDKEYADNVRKSADIAAVIKFETGIELKPQGDRLLGLCPFHIEETPSFTVTPETGRYCCLGCDAEGDAVDFSMRWHEEDNLFEAAESVERITWRNGTKRGGVDA